MPQSGGGHTWGLACPQPPAAAPPAGQLNERAARGLDFVLAEAAKHGIKLTLALTNQWKEDGVEQWEQW